MDSILRGFSFEWIHFYGDTILGGFDFEGIHLSGFWPSGFENSGNFLTVVDPDQNFMDSNGKFHFRFWDFGEWKTIEVDDFLPTFSGKLRCAKSNNSAEFWSALAEKAYAKHYGNYAQALDGGLTEEALEDLTGGIAAVHSAFKL